MNEKLDKRVADALQSVRDDTNGNCQSEDEVLVIAYERAAFATAQLGSNLDSVELYGTLRYKILQRMAAAPVEP